MMSSCPTQRSRSRVASILLPKSWLSTKADKAISTMQYVCSSRLSFGRETSCLRWPDGQDRTHPVRGSFNRGNILETDTECTDTPNHIQQCERGRATAMAFNWPSPSSDYCSIASPRDASSAFSFETPPAFFNLNAIANSSISSVWFVRQQFHSHPVDLALCPLPDVPLDVLCHCLCIITICLNHADKPISFVV